MSRRRSATSGALTHCPAYADRLHPALACLPVMPAGDLPAWCACQEPCGLARRQPADATACDQPRALELGLGPGPPDGDQVIHLSCSAASTITTQEWFVAAGRHQHPAGQPAIEASACSTWPAVMAHSLLLPVLAAFQGGDDDH